MEELTCKICYETFENRNDLINPCKCDGSLKYVCKSCFNKILESNKGNSNFTNCSVCRVAYKRECKNFHETVSSEILPNALLLIILSSFMVLLFFVLSEAGIFSVYLCIQIIYLFSVFSVSLNSLFDEDIIFVFILLMYIGMFSGVKIGEKIIKYWSFAIFCSFCYIILTDSWNSQYKTLINQAIANSNPLFYDLELNRYVNTTI